MSNSQPSNMQNRPGSLFGLEKPPFSLSVAPKGSVRNGSAKSRFRGRPLARRAARTPLKGNGTRAVVRSGERGRQNRTGASEAAFRLRSARGWICRLAEMSQGSVTCADLTPFVRAVARTFTRAVRSLCRGPPRPPPLDQRSSKDIRGRQTLRTSAPRSTPRRPSLRAPYRYGTETK